MTSLQWIIAAIVFGAVEILSAGFWFLWLGLAALLVATGVSFGLLDSIQSQLLVFAILTLMFIIFTRPLLMKTVKSNDTASNVNALIGQHGICTSKISVIEFGQVKVNGEIWTASSDENIEPDTRVTVTGIDGVKLQVKRFAKD